MAVTHTTINSILNKIGSMYVIRLGSESYDIYGAGSVAFSTFSGIGYVQVLDDRDESVRAGLLNIGDAVGYFKLSIDAGSVIQSGSKIQVTHQGTNYQGFGDPGIPHLSGNQLLRIVNLRRVVE